MKRLSTISFEESTPQPDGLEENGLSSAQRTLQGTVKLGIAWLCATLMGVLGLMYSAASQSSPTWTILVLIGLLVGYAGYGYSIKKKNVVQFADSFYYMGFLWALCVLIAVFVMWPAPKLTVDAVLTAFGYALVTTFCGMLLRLVVMQFHDTVPDRLLDAQDTIDRRVAVLIEQINLATSEITSFKDRISVDLGATLQDLVRSLSDVRKKIAEQHETMTRAMTGGFESSLKDVLGRLAAIQIPQEILTTEVAKLVTMLGKRGEGFEQAAQKLEKSLMQTADTVTAFGNSVYGSEGAKLVGAAVHELSGEIKERTKQFREMTTILEKSRTELDGQLTSLQSLRSAFATVSTQLSTFEVELKDLSSTSMSADVRNGLLNVQKAVQSSLEASKAIESTMRDVLFFLRERMTEERSIDKK